MSDAWISVLASVAIALIGVGVTMYQTRSARAEALRVQASGDRQLTYDQLQEDLALLDERFNKYIAQAEAREQRDERKMRYLNAVNRVLDDEVNDLRKALAAAGLDVPQRKQLPPFPGDWSVTEAQT